MGVPEWHYKRALQNLAHGLAYTESAKKAKQLNEEPSEEVLKQFIFEKKEKNFGKRILLFSRQSYSMHY